MRHHDLQSSSFFPTNPYDFADIKFLTQKSLSLGLGLTVKPLSSNSDKDQFSPNNIHTLSTDKL